MLIEHIRDFLKKPEGITIPSALQAATEKFQGSLVRQMSGVERVRPEGTLYASDATKCPRKVLYSALGIASEPMPPDVKFKLLMGDMIELALVYVASLLPSVKLISNNQKMDFEIGGKARRGATDGIILEPNGKKTHAEFKSSSAISFKYAMKGGVDDSFGYLGQAEVYHRELKKQGMVNTDKTVFIYINRDSMHLGEVEHVYTGAYAAQADENFKIVDQCLATRKLPPRPYALKGNELPLQCSYCNYKYSCWTEPVQVVKFDPVNGEKLYRIQPTTTVEMKFDAKSKPHWFVV